MCVCVVFVSIFLVSSDNYGFVFSVHQVQKNYSLNDLLALMTHAAEVLMDVRDDLPRFNAGK